MPGTAKITSGLHWRHIWPTTCTQMQVQALAHTQSCYHWECSRSVTLYKMLALSSLTVATFIQEEYVGLLLSFNICCQLIVIIFSVGREYIGCCTIILLCLLWETSAVTKCLSKRKKKKRFSNCSYWTNLWTDVSEWLWLSSSMMVGFILHD